MTLPTAQWLIACSLVTVLVAGGLLPGLAWAGANDQSTPARQTIYIDPNTGDVIDSPGQAKRHDPAPPVENNRGDEHSAFDTDPTAPAIRCPDGSLRMGHAKAVPGQTERQALCAKPVR